MSKLTSIAVWVCLILCLKASGGQHVLKLGFVYDPYGPFSNALLGYDFYAHKINSAGGLAVGLNGTIYQIKIIKHSNNNRTDQFWKTSGSHISWDNNLGLWTYDDNRGGFPLEADRHYLQQRRLWTEDKVDFELGGTSNVAANETMTSARQNIINMVCCVGPDFVYEQSFPTETVFGMQCSNQKYTQETILTLALKGARTIAITYSNSLFTRTTCEAAKLFAIEQASIPYQIVYEYTYAQSWETTTDFTANPVYDAATNRSYDLKEAFTAMAAKTPDVWIHCGNMKSGVYGLKLLNTIGFRPKATLQTVAPNSLQTYMNLLGPLGNYVLGVGQWHPAMSYKDLFYGSASQYSASFKEFSGENAEYVGAGAAASAYVLGLAIQEHYKSIAHTPGVFNTAGIINSLKKMSRQTFFGDLQFNPYRRNVAKIPATFQNLPDSSQSSGINQACVLPVAFGNAEIVYPDPMSVPNVPSALSVFVIIAITVSAAFLVLVAIVIFLVYRHYNVDTNAIRIARSKNLPVHLSILKRATTDDLIRVIEENKEKVAKQYDLDGKTALDLALEEDIFSHDNISKDVVFLLFVDLFNEVYGDSNGDIENDPAADINPRIYCWAHLAQLSSEKALEIVEMILDHSPSRCKTYSRLFDEHGRQVVDIASPKCKLAILRRLWLNRRYEIKEGRPEHVSATAVVVIAVDHSKDSDEYQEEMTPHSTEEERSRTRSFSFHNSQKAPTMVALKFMRSHEQYMCEIRSRSCLAIQKDHVVGIIKHYGGGDGDLEEQTAFRLDAIAKGFQAYPYCLVMEAADDTLKRIIGDQHIAGTEWDEIKSITKQVASALRFVHSNGFIHGDIKPSNIIQIGQKIKLIDLDAAANFLKADFAGAKYSSGFIPPELLYLDIDGYPKVRSYTIVPYTSEMVHGPFELVPANPAIDMWALGVLLFLLCTGSSLFQCSVDDNIFKREDLLSLYSWGMDISVPILAKVANRYARNLISMLLSKDPSRRPSPSRVLDHPFLSNKRSVRLPGEEAIYDVFLSYRVASDCKIAELIYESLTAIGITVWFDKVNILPGRYWEQEFADGLLTSSCFVCLLSRNAINHPTKPVQNFNTLTSDSKADNVLMEWSLALEFAERGLLTKIYPVMIGDKTIEETEGEPTVCYTNYFASGCHPSACKDIVVDAVEQRTSAHLDRQGLGHPYRNTASVQTIVGDIVSRQGSFIEGDLTLSVKKLVGEVCTMIRHTSAKRSVTPTKKTSTSPTVQIRKRPEFPNIKPVDFIPARVKYGQSKSNPGSSATLPMTIGIEAKESDTSMSLTGPPKMSSPGRFLREDQSV